jgi:single-strand DNA-binding protein
MHAGTNVVVLRGVLVRPVERRMLGDGSSVLSLEVATREEGGRAAVVPVAWPEAPAAADDLAVETELVVTGWVRRRFFRAGGGTQSRTEVVAEAVVPAAQARRARRAVEQALARVDG